MRKNAVETEWILKSIRAWAALYGEPPSSMDWDLYKAKRQASFSHYEKVLSRRQGRHWPVANTVIQRFDTWNAAIEKAGFKPRQIGGQKGKRR